MRLLVVCLAFAAAVADGERSDLQKRLASLETSVREAKVSLEALDGATAKPRGSSNKQAKANRAIGAAAQPIDAAAKPIYAILGGSNTLGARNIKGGTGPNWQSFGKQLCGWGGFAANYTAKWTAQGALGPAMAAACSHSFIPAGTRLVTLEFLPNMGYTGHDSSEIGEMEQLISTALGRGARTVVVIITPGNERLNATFCPERTVGCTSRVHVLKMRDALVKLADKYKVKTVVLDADVDRHLFGTDAMHANQEGHDYIFRTIQAYLADWPLPKAKERKAIETTGVKCFVGDELAPLVQEAQGFSRIDMARPEQGAPKIGWEATQPGSSMALCADLPRNAQKVGKEVKAALHYASRAEGATDSASARSGLYSVAVGMQVSHALSFSIFLSFYIYIYIYKYVCVCLSIFLAISIYLYISVFL